ncbi:hypothetical protein HCN44_009637 [Aphidius gifuensis]|uniref:BHLH domain-containing protein n=1 Tax=Aphidius gifuensis TaxID=684658 RepID=A0A835CWD4_APHGI|nr:general transcriptional corepressor trfA [Aphidius gifuensis]KAF7998239.1 hypothetical protein HCN44_009637 [Aphidius gifuensis]
MSVFSSGDERILIEEIVETTTDEQETEICSNSETWDECSLAAATLVEVSECQDQDSDNQQTTNHNNNNNNNNNNINYYQRTRKNQSGQVIRNGNRLIDQNNTDQGSDEGDNDINTTDSTTPRSHMEQEKRMRREIANSNERRRMQSINAGFQSLRTLLPHHEGEKLSKAAILQQTAEYIYQLEQEKTQLLSQNCQLKRLVNQHEGGDVPIKKRKTESQGVVVSLPIHISESGDEGLGSMSPEPMSVITVSSENHSVVSNSSTTSTSSEIVDLKRQLEKERHQRLHLEKQMRTIHTQRYPERFRDNQLIAYQPHEVIEHTDNVMAQETEEAVNNLQVVSVMSIPAVGSTQTVETSSPDPGIDVSPVLSPQCGDLIDDIKDEMITIHPSSPKILTFTNAEQLYTTVIEEEEEEQQSETTSTATVVVATTPPTTLTNDSFTPTIVTYASANEFNNKNNNGAQFIAASPTRSFSPTIETPRLPSVLEAAMKAEPKVEVERLPSPASSIDDGTSQTTRLYLANTSRQNLETIVEAIRHLEGDHFLGDEPSQDTPLALTNKPSATSATTSKRLLHAEVNNFLQFHTHKQTQQRPGVIVVKHS